LSTTSVEIPIIPFQAFSTFHPNAPEHYVSAAVVAEYLGIERRQVLQMTRDAKLPGHPVDPWSKRKTWRYKLSEVEAALEGGARKPDNGAGSPRGRKE